MNRRRFFQLGAGVASGFATLRGALAGQTRTSSKIPCHEKAGPALLELKNYLLQFQANWCNVPDWGMSIEVDGAVLKTSSARTKLISQEPFRVEFRFLKHQLIWKIEARLNKADGSVLVFSEIHNQSQRPLALGKAWLLQTERLTGFFVPGDDLVFLPIFSGQYLNPVQKFGAKRVSSADGIPKVDVAVQMFNQTQAKALQAGFVSFEKCKTHVNHGRDENQRVRLEAWCDFDGWELAPGASTSTETLILATGENPHAQLEAWADKAAQLCRPRPREWQGQANGWLGWSWVDPFTVERYEDVVWRNAHAIRSRLEGFGIDYIWVALGNLNNCQPGDWLDWSTRNFPDGHQYLREQLQALGFKWGLWCGPFMMSSKLEKKVEEFQDALFKQPDGKQPVVYSKQWAYGWNKPNEDIRRPIYELDPSHPKTLVFLRKVFATYREWGVRYYMIDFLWAGADTLDNVPHAKHYDKKLVSGPEVLRKGLQAIREACGDDTYLLASSGPTLHTAGFADAVRTGNDFGEGRPLGPGFDSDPGTSIIDAPKYWRGPVWALTNQAATYYTNRKLYVNDSADVLTVDKPIALNQAQVFATIHAMSGAPSMLGDDIAYLDEDRIQLIKKTLPRPTEVAFPVDLFEKRRQEYPRVLHRKIVKSWGSYDVVAVYNLEPDKAIRQEIHLKSLGLDESRTYLGWEFWAGQYLGKIQGSLQAEVPPYSVRVYRLIEYTGQPALVGTDLHLLMGEMEIDQSAWDAERRILSGRAIRPPRERGSVFVYAPPKMRVANPKGLFLAKDGKDDSLIIRCPLEFPEGSAEWNIRFTNL